MDPLLEVRVVHPSDAEAAQEGGADRLLVVALGPGGESDLRSPEPALVSALGRVSEVPLRVVLRLDDGDTTTGAGLVRLAGLASDYLSAGAEGVAYGFLDSDLEIDTELCAELAGRTGMPWTFTRAFDRALEPRRAWRAVKALPGIDGVLTAGSVLGADQGHEVLLEAAEADPVLAGLAIAAGGVRAEHVPWLVRAGVRRIHLGAAVRPAGSWGKAYTDSALVRSWRLLLDDAVARASSA
jgi:copper homeostasis protein